MTLKLYPQEDIQDIADAIRAQNGLSSTYSVGEMAAAISAISGGGGTDYVPSLITKTLKSYSNSSISRIGLYAFAYCSALTSISFPACTSIDNYAFYYCSVLSSISFPVCTSIGGYAFAYCSALTSLTSISFPACKSIGNFAFAYCSALTSISFPACTSIGQYTFSNCRSLATATFGSSTSARLTISASAFVSCYNLLSLYLLNTSTSVASLVNVNAFTSTPISNYTTSTGGVYGSIYVPASLYDAYIVSTNWVTYSDRFVSI